MNLNNLKMDMIMLTHFDFVFITSVEVPKPLAWKSTAIHYLCIHITNLCLNCFFYFFLSMFAYFFFMITRLSSNSFVTQFVSLSELISFMSWILNSNIFKLASIYFPRKFWKQLFIDSHITKLCFVHHRDWKLLVFI